MEKPSERKRRTIGTIRNEDPILIPRAVYTCEAKLISIEEGYNWYYHACPKCNKKIILTNEGYSCTKCQETGVKYMYCITGTIADGTGTATVTMFGSAVASMLGVSCYDMIHEHSNYDNKKMPSLMHSIKGITKIFQLEKGKLDQTGLRFAVNKVFTANSRAVFQSTPPEKGVGQTSASTTKEPSSSTGLTKTKTRRVLFNGQETHPEEGENKRQRATSLDST